MKLVKSLLLGSVAGVAAVASAQAADLPFRKAAPVEYVRVCDFTGAGYFYIPGTDTCLKIEGYLRAEFAAINQSNAYFPTAPTVAQSSGQQNIQNGQNFFAPGGGGFLPRRNRDLTGFKADGRIAADARTQTAYGTLRTYVRFDIVRVQGNYALGSSGNTFTDYANSASTSPNLDKGYIQFAGLTAGRVQSFFDFYADNYNFEGIANSDQSTNVLAYTYTFGGGFSATIAAEDRTTRTGPGIGNIGALGVAGVGNGIAGLGASYAGQTIPDIVGAVRVDQAWGAAQISAAYHDVDTTSAGVAGNQFVTAQTDGFAVQAGIQIKLPMLAAGDDLWLEGAYQEGAYLYQDSAGGLNQGFNNLAVGGFQHIDHDAVAVANAAGNGYTLQKGTGFSVMAALHHYFTPQFHDVLFGSYEEIGYGNTVRSTPFDLGGLGDASEYRIGNDFIFTPVHNLDIGLEVIYAHIDQDIAGTNAGAIGQAATVARYNAGVAPFVKQNPDAFEGRLRVERDF